MRNIKLSAFSDEYSDSFTEQCNALSRLGIEYMEIRGVDGKNVSTLDKNEIKEVKRILCEYGIKISAIGSPIGKIKLDGDIDKHIDMAKHIFETACELETKNIRMFSFYLPDGKNRAACKTQVLFELERLVELSARYGILLCHENEALIYGEDPESCLEIAEHFEGRLRCVFDMGNFVLDGYEPMAAYELLKPHIEYFHIKDALYAGAIVPAGKGEARIKEVLDAYRSDDGEEVFITLEPHLQTFSGLNALVGKSFDNPYKYENQKKAFEDAYDHLRRLI